MAPSTGKEEACFPQPLAAASRFRRQQRRLMGNVVQRGGAEEPGRPPRPAPPRPAPAPANGRQGAGLCPPGRRGSMGSCGKLCPGARSRWGGGGAGARARGAGGARSCRCVWGCSRGGRVGVEVEGGESASLRRRGDLSVILAYALQSALACEALPG